MVDDKTIIEDIRARYVGDDRIPHPAEIAVSAQHGNVTLRGTVGGVPQLHAAAQIAKSARGVSRVDNELSLDPRDHWDDAELRGTALQALIADDGVPADHIDVYVTNGWLTLKGEVKHQYENDAAFEAVSQLPGVGRNHERDKGRHGERALNRRPCVLRHHAFGSVEDEFTGSDSAAVGSHIGAANHHGCRIHKLELTLQ